MGINLEPEQKRKLLAYLVLLEKWNRAYNLTAVRDPEEMVSRQLLDALSILDLLTGRRVLDVGTGAGLPGIPLAVARPEWRFTLLDANGKKTRFVQQAKMELGLDNLTVIQARVEQFPTDDRFDSIVSRAFSSLPQFVELALPLLGENGILVAMKGVSPEDEIKTVEAKGMIVHCKRLQVPLSAAERHAIMIFPAH
jgi:16S rRNA (guanine527-N7)-methyltransferase